MSAPRSSKKRGRGPDLGGPAEGLPAARRRTLEPQAHPTETRVLLPGGGDVVLGADLQERMAERLSRVSGRSVAALAPGTAAPHVASVVPVEVAGRLHWLLVPGGTTVLDVLRRIGDPRRQLACSGARPRLAVLPAPLLGRIRVGNEPGDVSRLTIA